MTTEIVACIRIRMGGLIMLFSSGVTAFSTVKALQTEGDVFVGGEVRSAKTLWITPDDLSQ